MSNLSEEELQGLLEQSKRFHKDLPNLLKLKREGVPYTKIAKEYGYTANTVSKWIREAERWELLAAMDQIRRKVLPLLAKGMGQTQMGSAAAQCFAEAIRLLENMSPRGRRPL